MQSKKILLGAVCAMLLIRANTTVYATEQKSIPADAAETDMTAEDAVSTTMWAKTKAPYRSSASADSSELGTLSQYEEVTVIETSGDWCRISLKDGREAYVPAAFLTSEDPHNRELNIYNKETGLVDTYTFRDQDPVVIDGAIESIREEYASKAETEEDAIGPETEESAISEDIMSDVKPASKNTSGSVYRGLTVAAAIGASLVFCMGVFFLIYNKVRGRVD